MKISRRKFVGYAAKSTALIASALETGQLFAAGSDTPVNLKLFPSERSVWDDVVYMNNLGVRFSGSPAHTKFVKFLEDGLISLGMKLDPIPHTSLVRWDLCRYALSIASGPQSGKELRVGFCGRYGETTGEQGVTGELIYCGKAEVPQVFSYTKNGPRSMPSVPPNVRGKIALIEVNAAPWPYGEMWKGHVRGVYNSSGSTLLPAVQKTAAAYTAARLPMDFKENLQRAGAIGVVFAWSNLADDDASGQLKVDMAVIPELWVGQTAGRELKELAAKGGQVKLIVDADTVSNVPTHTTVATLPGQSDETILLWTHTDGNNAVEENGGVAILNLMKYFSRLAPSDRKRSITCVLSEAHFNEQYISTSAWMKERPDLVRKAVAEVTIEHLGCGEWVDDPESNSYKATGERELAFAFCPKDPMSDVMLEALKGTNSGKTAVIDTDLNAFTPAILGYRISKIPTIVFIAAPPYLLSQGPHGHIEKLSSRQFHEQTIALAKVIHRLHRIPKSELGGREAAL